MLPSHFSADLDRFLMAMDRPFTSPVHRALTIADAVDSAPMRAAFLPRVLDLRGSIVAHRHAMDTPGINQRLVLESLIQLIDRDSQTMREEARATRDEWWERFGRPLSRRQQPYTNTPDPEHPPVVGYVSANFKHSSAGNCLKAIVLNHTEMVRPICYSTNPARADDPISWVFQTCCRYVNVADLTEAQFADRVRADGVDILIDCMSFTRGNRLGTFAERPAPIQLTGWGYATGTMPAMDGVLLDSVTRGSDLFHERVIELPCVISYTPPVFGPAIAPAPTGPVTFGAFHCFVKITPEVLAVWARILDRVPGSRIVFKGHEYGEAMLRDRITIALGAERCAFWPQTQHLEHLDAFRHVDLVLDPWPQTGGITTCEALHQGVPSVTLIGERTIQRAAASILHLVGFYPGIAATPDAYVDRAVELVTTSRVWLAAERPFWRERLRASSICTGYVAAVEAVYGQLWREWCATVRQTAVA